MCAVSMIMDHYTDKWNHLTVPYKQPSEWTVPAQPAIPQKDIDEFYELLERARKYDRENNQPDCELEGKKETLKKLAEQLGVEINFPE